MEKSLGKASSKFGRDASQVERVKTRKGNSKQKAPAHFTQEAGVLAWRRWHAYVGRNSAHNTKRKKRLPICGRNHVWSNFFFFVFALAQYLPPLLKAIVTTDSMERAPNYAGCVLEILRAAAKKTTAHKAGCQMEKSLGKASSKFGRDASQVERVKTRKGNSKQKAPAHFTQEAGVLAWRRWHAYVGRNSAHNTKRKKRLPICGRNHV
ncbi:hypothetical protein BDR26DRAFT_903550 [Obelidium mucronatum]|nr:hypothetical protein BDR26DRAFT_903550 [Obelidium mucronatum]